ncbi:MAG TPA: diaminopimelate decarboxylase [Clostridiales bacterium]|nr:diaminopimelate decarboxylase [Clostridia bacterium]HCS73322.1 diaminopimelate decarboxylase [Clostridiales bacterium]
MYHYFTNKTDFYGNTNPQELLKKYGSPLYVYNENILRKCCRDMADFIPYNNCNANYSTKANGNLELLKIIREEGLNADAMSPGEIHVLLAAGFQPEQILYIGNNVSIEEMMFAVNKGITISVDSLSQLKTYGQWNPGGDVVVRINPGFGIGHHERVITGGKNTKFGINDDRIPEIKALVKEYNLNLTGINQHIGSLFMEGDIYIQSIRSILQIAEQFEELRFIDMGGGFGIPYQKQKNEKPLELKVFGEQLAELLSSWAERNNPDIRFMTEPGRYVVAESGILLGTVHSEKENSGVHFIGTDLGFNVLIRPVMYDAWHDIEVYPQNKEYAYSAKKRVTIVGNICESGDTIASSRKLPALSTGDIIGVMDAGAYGYSMSSNYNNRLRPAEVLIQGDGTDKLVRRRDTLEDLLQNFDINNK